jgi:HD-like signal output (HDOD) protein
MSSKKTLKEKNQTVHTISVLCSLLLENIDKLSNQSTNENREDFKDNLQEVEKVCEIIIDGSAVKEVKNSTYIQGMANKLDTIIRKNFRDI